MWKASIGLKPAVPPKPNADDDWETDPDFINDVSEKQSRWGAKTVEGSGHQESIRLDQLRDEVLKSDRELKEKQDMPKASSGYGGKFGVEKGRQDASAVGYDHNEKATPHASQKDYKSGFGGAFGKDNRQDKSAYGWESREKPELHESQKDYKSGFGGQFGTDNRQDKSAHGWESREKPELHESQKDYKTGFGGAFGIQKDRQDKNAVGWESREKPELHESQKDYKSGFGGSNGLQHTQDKSAHGWHEKPEKSVPFKTATDVPTKSDASSLRNKFEQLASSQQQDDKVQQERERRKREDEELRRREAERQANVDVPAQSYQKVVREDIPKSDASNLRNKFEQLSTQKQDDKVQQERERRKREDEELKRRNEEAERLRQQRIEEQHSQMPDVEEHEERHVEPSSPPQSSRNRTSMGVRLPIAPPSVEPTQHEHVPVSLPEPDLYEEPPAEPEAPRVQVLPTNNLPLRGALPRRQSSTTDDECKGDWEDTPEPNVFKLPSAHVPEEPSEPIPTVHVSNNNTVFSASPPHQSYDFVPDPEQTEPYSSSSHVSHTQPSSMYDYVPDEPPAMQATLASNSMYEEPPSMQATLTSHDLYEEPPTEAEPPAPQSSSGMTAVALFEYEKQDDDEIGFQVNDIITNIEQIDAGWWRGFCKDRYGLFPSNYVQLQ